MEDIRRWGVLILGVGALFLLKGVFLSGSIESGIIYQVCLFFLVIMTPVPPSIGGRNIILTMSTMFTVYFLLATLLAAVHDATGAPRDLVIAALLFLLGAVLVHPRFDLTPLAPDR